MVNAFISSRQQWEPKPYQIRAVSYLLERGGAGLFLLPGMGKTAVTLMAFDILREKGINKRMLVIAPRRPMYEVWPREINKWADFSHLKYVVLHGSDKEEALKLDADVYIINPEGLQWLFSDGRLQKLGVDVLCVDELHKFKHTNTQRFKMIRPLLPRFKRRWGLTGSPAANGLMGLFGECYMLDMGAALGRYITHFRNKYFTQDYMGYDWRPNPDSFEDIMAKIKPLAMYVDEKEYVDLPEVVNLTVDVTLPKEARQKYDTMEAAFIIEIEKDVVAAASAAVAGIKCRQIANGAIYNEARETKVIHSEKLDALEGLLEELNGSPALVAYEFVHDLHRILERFPGTPYIGGGQSDAKVAAYCMRFNNGELPMLLAHPASAGHGLNLQQTANNVIWFGIPWDFDLYDQMLRRVRRQGNPNSHVFVHHIIARDTLDEKVLAVLAKKDRVQQSVFAALKEDLRNPAQV